MNRLKKTIFAAIIAIMMPGICSCGSDKAASSQGLTDALEKKQQEVDSALQQMEEASQALNGAAEEKDNR